MHNNGWRLENSKSLERILKFDENISYKIQILVLYSAETLILINYTNTNRRQNYQQKKKFFQIFKILTYILLLMYVSCYHMTCGRQNRVPFNLKLLFSFFSHFAYKVHSFIRKSIFQIFVFFFSIGII